MSQRFAVSTSRRGNAGDTRTAASLNACCRSSGVMKYLNDVCTRRCSENARETLSLLMSAVVSRFSIASEKRKDSEQNLSDAGRSAGDLGSKSACGMLSGSTYESIPRIALLCESRIGRKSPRVR